MHKNDKILGYIKFKNGFLKTPENGKTDRLLRVELADEQEPDSNWISEIKVLGDLPWYEEEERQVELRIMSEEFKSHVKLNHPNLFVRYGSIDVGILKIII